MIRPLLAVSLLAALPGADLALGTPCLNVWRDDVALRYTVVLPPGGGTVALPRELPGEVQVVGASWRLEERRESAPVEPLPPAWEALRVARNAWAAERQRRHESDAAHQAQERRLRAALPGTADLAGATAAIEGWLAQDGARAAADARLAAIAADLARQAQDLLGDRAADEDLLALGNPSTTPVLTPEALAAAWAHRPRPEIRTRVVHLQGTGPATLSLALDGITWDPAATLAVAAGKARLLRRVRLTKPATLDLGAVPVTVSTSPRRPVLGDVTLRPVDSRLRELHAKEKGIASVGSQTIASRSVPEQAPVRVTTMDAPAAKGAEAEGGAQPAREAVPATPSPAASEAPGLAEVWDLGTLTLGRDLTTTTVDLPPSSLTILGDQVAWWPDTGALPVRRLGVRLDARPLQAGPLTLVVDGTTIATQDLGTLAAGSDLWLSAGEVTTLWAEPAVPWDLSQESTGPRRQVAGTSTRLRNLGTTTATMTVVRVQPLSRSEGITVTSHPRTTAGRRMVEPGLWHWTVTLPPGGSTVLDHGWIVTSDHLDL